MTGVVVVGGVVTGGSFGSNGSVPANISSPSRWLSSSESSSRGSVPYVSSDLIDDCIIQRKEVVDFQNVVPLLPSTRQEIEALGFTLEAV